MEIQQIQGFHIQVYAPFVFFHKVLHIFFILFHSYVEEVKPF